LALSVITVRPLYERVAFGVKLKLSAESLGLSFIIVEGGGTLWTEPINNFV